MIVKLHLKNTILFVAMRINNCKQARNIINLITVSTRDDTGFYERMVLGTARVAPTIRISRNHIFPPTPTLCCLTVDTCVINYYVISITTRYYQTLDSR